MSRGRKFTKEEIDIIIQYYSTGLSCKEIGKNMDRNTNVVRELLKRENVFVNKVNYFSKEEVENIATDYHSGMSLTELSKKYSRGKEYILAKLKNAEIIHHRNNRFTKEDEIFLIENYKFGDWDILKNRFPNVSKESLQTKASKLRLHDESVNLWNEFDLSIIKDNYFDKSLDELEKMIGFRHSKNSITTKAFRYFNYSKSRKWTGEEKQILINNYSILHVDEILKLLPNRTRNAIIEQAIKLKLQNVAIWKEQEIKYISENWENYPDIILAENLNKTFRAVKAKREELGLYRQDKSIKNYETISKYIRSNIIQWKKDSMKNCNYQCTFTGSKNFEIHHPYAVSSILKDVFKKYNIKEKDSFSEYTDEELSFILEKFIQEQNKYPLGVCIEKNIHVLFHSLYGQYYCTPQQWYQFEKDFKNGTYHNMLKKKIA